VVETKMTREKKIDGAIGVTEAIGPEIT